MSTPTRWLHSFASFCKVGSSALQGTQSQRQKETMAARFLTRRSAREMRPPRTSGKLKAGAEAPLTGQVRVSAARARTAARRRRAATSPRTGVPPIGCVSALSTIIPQLRIDAVLCLARASRARVKDAPHRPVGWDPEEEINEKRPCWHGGGLAVRRVPGLGG
jgi:hypothetical protein